jgi:transcriptional regulator with XRE-family HTH domain
MPASPKRSGKKARGESVFLSEVVAGNIARKRETQGLTQEQVAERMRGLGHDWARATVSEVERQGRLVSVEELGGLALALSTTILELLSLSSPSDAELAIDHGGPRPISHWLEYLWLHELVWLAWEWDEGEPPEPMLGVQLTEHGRWMAGQNWSVQLSMMPKPAIEVLHDLWEADSRMRKRWKELQETFVEMGMDATHAESAVRVRHRPALYYLVSPDLEYRQVTSWSRADDLANRPLAELLPDDNEDGQHESS